MHSSGHIGEVKTQFFTTGSADDPVVLRDGSALPEVTLAYETYGRLNQARDNAVLIFHALSGSQHAAGTNTAVEGVDDLWIEECHRGWWDTFIGPGRAFDTDRFFVVCANYLGGCYGSTGPGSINPETGKPFGSSFPRIAVDDIVDSQLRLLDHFGIRTLHAVTGSSLGGMLCLNLATRFPERVQLVIPIATGVETTSLQRITNLEQIYAIEIDPHFQGGDYYGGPRPDKGVALARMIAHKTYVSLQTLQMRAEQEIRQHGEHLRFYELTHSIESYMLHQGAKFVDRFDANTYLRILDAWQRADLVGSDSTLDAENPFTACRHQRYLVFSIDSDVCYYPDQQETLIRLLKAARVPQRRITVHSEKGHDSFLLEPALFTPHLSHALEREW